MMGLNDCRLVSDLVSIAKIVSGPVILNHEIWTSVGGTVDDYKFDSLLHEQRSGGGTGVVIRKVNKWYKTSLSPPVKLIVAMEKV